MAKRFTDTNLWDKEWFMKLKPKVKCLVKFVRDKADLCGVWSPNWIIANTSIGDKVTERDLLDVDGGNQFFKMPNGKIFCIGFVQFQYGELSMKSPVHRKIIGLLKQNNLLELYQQIGYQHPINRVKEEVKEKEGEEETEEVKEKPLEILNDVDCVIEYLNQKAGTQYRKNAPKNADPAKARFKDGFTIKDFQDVIDHKVATWGPDEKMREYLRPETLFGNKFEGYLNAARAGPLPPTGLIEKANLLSKKQDDEINLQYGN